MIGSDFEIVEITFVMFEIMLKYPSERTKEPLQIKEHIGANIESERKRMYHLEATLTMSRTLPLYILRLISFPSASCKQKERRNRNATRI